MYRITVERGNDAALWWEHVQAGASEAAPEEIRSLLQIGGPPYVIVEDSDTIIAWAQKIPGWSDPSAPNSAKHPLYIVWIEE